MVNILWDDGDDQLEWAKVHEYILLHDVEWLCTVIGAFAITWHEIDLTILQEGKKELLPGTVAPLPVDWTALPVGGTNHVIKQLMTGSSGSTQPVGLGLHVRTPSTNILCSFPQNQSSVVYCWSLLITDLKCTTFWITFIVKSMTMKVRRGAAAMANPTQHLWSNN